MLYAVCTYIEENPEDSYVECITDDMEVVRALQYLDSDSKTAHFKLSAENLEDAIRECTIELSMYNLFEESVREDGITKYSDLAYNLVFKFNSVGCETVSMFNSIQSDLISLEVNMYQFEVLVNQIVITLPMTAENLNERVSKLTYEVNTYRFVTDIDDKISLIRELTRSIFSDMTMSE